MSSLAGLEAEDPVTSEQMSNLFGYGYHPLYDPKWQPITREEARTDRETTWKLGRPYPIHSRDVSPFRIELARRVTALGEQMPGDVPADVRARERTETAIEFPSGDDTTASHIRPHTPIPRRLLNHPEWGRYLEARQQLEQHFSTQLLPAEPASSPSPEVASGGRRTPQPAPTLTPEHARPRGPGR